MAVHWINRLSLTLAGAPRTEAEEAQDCPTLTRRSAVRGALGFGVALALGGLTPRTAGAAAPVDCVKQCQDGVDLAAGQVTRGCLKRLFAGGPAVVWIPGARSGSSRAR